MVQLTVRGSARIAAVAVTGLVAGNRRDAGAPDDAQGSQASSWKAGETGWTETGLARFQQEAFGRSFQS